MEENEPEFTDIPDFPNYQLSRTYKVRNKKTGRILKINMSGGTNGKTYPGVRLYKKGKQYKRFIHRLMVIVFHNRQLRSIDEIDHNDKDVLNPDLSNLEVTTKAENLRRRWL